MFKRSLKTRARQWWLEHGLTTHHKRREAEQAIYRRADERANVLVAEEQDRTRAILDGASRIRLTAEYNHRDDLEVYCRVAINRHMLYQMVDSSAVWQHFADRMAHQIERELRSINFATVRRGIGEDWRR